jgi:hypothetical protein
VKIRRIEYGLLRKNQGEIVLGLMIIIWALRSEASFNNYSTTTTWELFFICFVVLLFQWWLINLSFTYVIKLLIFLHQNHCKKNINWFFSVVQNLPTNNVLLFIVASLTIREYSINWIKKDLIIIYYYCFSLFDVMLFQH